jgi:hypothetical protein
MIEQRNRRGFAAALDYLVNDTVPDGDPRLLLNTEATQLAYDCDGVNVSTRGGQTFRARQVVFTLPLGVLQRRHHDLFAPPLPKEKVQVLEHDGLVMANLTHVLLQFPSVWWDNSLPRWVSANAGAEFNYTLAGEFAEWQNLNHVSRVEGWASGWVLVPVDVRRVRLSVSLIGGVCVCAARVGGTAARVSARPCARSC